LQYRTALRLGLRQIKGFSEADARKLIEARGAGYRDAADLWRRSGQGRAALERLAEADALRSLTDGQGELDRRRGLWALKALGAAPLPLFANGQEKTVPTPPAVGGRGRHRPSLHRSSSSEEETRAASLLPEMPLGEHVVEDYATVGLSLKRHPLAFLRGEFAREGFVTAADLATMPVDSRLAIAGLVLIRQRPGSAKGGVFITLEDETGVANLVIWPDVFEKQRKIVMGARLMAVHGIIQKDEDDGVIHVVARRLEDHSFMLRQLSEDSLPSTLSQGDATGSWRPPAARHPRDVEIIPKSRDFH